MPYMELELLTLSFVLLFFCPDWTLCSNIYLMWLLCVYLIMAEFILLTLPGLFFYNVLVLCLYCYFCIRIELFVQNMHVYTMCACNFQRIVITVYSYEYFLFINSNRSRFVMLPTFFNVGDWHCLTTYVNASRIILLGEGTFH